MNISIASYIFHIYDKINKTIFNDDNLVQRVAFEFLYVVSCCVSTIELLLTSIWMTTTNNTQTRTAAKKKYSRDNINIMIMKQKQREKMIFKNIYNYYCIYDYDYMIWSE